MVDFAVLAVIGYIAVFIRSSDGKVSAIRGRGV
jgi:hypothetical protein